MGIFKKSQSKKEDLSAGKQEKKEEVKVEIPRSVPAHRQAGASGLHSSASLVKHPWITEKAGRLIDSENKYIFLVDKKMNKPQTAKAIESIYGVKVLSVNIINKKGKTKRLGRSTGKIPGHKKAIVQLGKGHKIDVMPT